MELKVGQRIQTKAEAVVADKVDVLVAGGGTAGVIAAIAAGRAGASVMLVENRGTLGGMMTWGNGGLTKYTIHDDRQSEHRKIISELANDPASVQIVGGIPLEITNKLIENGCALGTEGQAGSYVFPAQEDFKLLLLNMMEEAESQTSAVFTDR
jgi:ribulose 1,5-bisphosphate synthetase/thiazole synthase